MYILTLLSTQVSIEDWYINDASAGMKRQQQLVYSKQWVDQWVEQWRNGTVYDSYIGASEEIDLAAAQVRNHMGDLFSTVHEQVAMPPKMKLGLLKVGVTWFPQGWSDSWSSQGCCDWEKNLGHWLPTTLAGGCSSSKVFIFTESPSFILYSFS